jgi:hypothetical protein
MMMLPFIQATPSPHKGRPGEKEKNTKTKHHTLVGQYKTIIT